jgi:hypothetical protein
LGCRAIRRKEEVEEEEEEYSRQEFGLSDRVLASEEHITKSEEE